MTEPIQKIDTRAQSEVSVDQRHQDALPLLPRQLIDNADRANAWASALGDY
jgi:hypothetical protein